MNRKFWNALALTALALLAACGGGGGNGGSSLYGGGSSGGTSTTTSVNVGLTLSTTTVTSAAPATVTAKVVDNKNNALGGVVVSFSVGQGLGALSSTSALTDSSGVAKVTLSPADSTKTGADTLTASATANGITGSASVGFQLTATTADIASVTATTGIGDTSATAVGPYGQTVLTLALNGVSEGAPATVTLNSACLAKGKATISPTSITTTSSTVTATYTDSGGCGSQLASDTVTVTLAGSGKTKQGTVYLTSPAANSLTFVSASPSTIYLRGSGLTESSTVVFQLNDTAGNPLPGKQVSMTLTTFAGGVQLDGGVADVTKTTDSKGQVQAIVNSGSVPTPVRIKATLVGSSIVTVSNQLSIGVGLPSQLNFSLSAQTYNMEGGSIDGEPNLFSVYAADRSGNPVPEGTAITFWAEGGQVQTSVATTLNSAGISVAKASFASQEPRPIDGRITIVAYAIGEESFIDLDGNNQYTPGEPFQDLGDVIKDRLFDNVFDPKNDEYVTLGGNLRRDLNCDLEWPKKYPQLALSANIPSNPSTCDSAWSSKTYVRRAIEIVLSTSEAGLLWNDTSGLDSSSCHKSSRIYDSAGSTSDVFVVRSGDTWYGGASTTGTIYLIGADANQARLNPMPRGTTFAISNATPGLTVTPPTSAVPNTTTVNLVPLQYSFANGVVKGQFNLDVKTPGGTVTTYSLGVVAGVRPSTCP